MGNDNTITFEAKVNFTLYCDSCVANHTIQSDDVERAWYVVQAALTDLRDDARHATTDPEFVPDGGICPLEALVAADDVEVYHEHVTACVESRQRNQGD